ncbi:hypothetical protein GCM10007108_03700 [Thermogymnomonas acidicola]|uniref:Transposase n=1 Tax=Thermogymnomonas acidicola TaxID=399579 RepID=A0AA37BQA8_9ARCH|nr:hypothetical protein [Thermogymnomonas acidicola]GGM68831.1 hypothetical protein GCM10007108_03700 [Thermogymnomonas acidicola]
MVISRNDRYVINEERMDIYLKQFHLTLKFKGKLKWNGKQGRSEIIYDEAGKWWYAHIPAEFEHEAEKGKLTASVDWG